VGVNGILSHPDRSDQMLECDENRGLMTPNPWQQ
jgi:hypothetical protein